MTSIRYFEEYQSAPFWGAGDTIAVLDRYYDGLGFLAVHNVQPEDSTNYDLSFEHDFANGLSAKFTPYYPIGPDSYTGTFDAPGSLNGPSWLAMNLGTYRTTSDTTPRRASS